MKRYALLAVALFALAACEEKKTETKPEDPTAKNATSATPAADTAKPATPQAVSINDSDISTPADFEESAEKSIDKKNYKTELTTLETDIAKD